MTIVVWSRSCISKNSAEIFVIYYGFEKNSHFSPKLGHCVGLWLKAPRDYCYSEVRSIKMDMDTRQELKEATTLLESAKGPRVRAALSTLVASLSVETPPAAAAEAEAEATADTSDDQPKSAANGFHPIAEAASSTPMVANGIESAEDPVAAAPAPAPAKIPLGPVRSVPKAGGIRYMTFDSFAWDQGGYNSPKVSVYVPLEGVGTAKDRVACSFSTRGFDLTVTDFNGNNYRLVQNNLEKDVVTNESSCIVKKNKIILKLAKVKGEFGSYDHWSKLTAKTKRPAANKSDPSAGIMDMMKDMYDDGDDSMKKVIGEAMMKSRQNQRPSTPSFDDPPPSFGSDKAFNGGGLGAGLDGMDDFGDDDLGLGLGGGLGAKGKDDWGLGNDDNDFGFGNKTPPLGTSDPVPAAPEEDDEEVGGVGKGKPSGGAVPAVVVEDGMVADEEGGPEAGVATGDINSLEELDD